LQLLSGRLQTPENAVEFHELLFRKLFRAIENFTGTVIRLAYFVLLLVGEGHDAKRQDLVDLCAVEEAAWALWRNLRIVVEDDG
jgi:hypothetical protein